MSRRWGISIPSSSFPNEICFINSGMYHPRLRRKPPRPRLPQRSFAVPEAGRKNELGLYFELTGSLIGRGRSKCDWEPGTERSRPVPHSHSHLLHLDRRALLFELGLE